MPSSVHVNTLHQFINMLRLFFNILDLISVQVTFINNSHLVKSMDIFTSNTANNLGDVTATYMFMKSPLQYLSTFA